MADGQPKMVFLGFGKFVRADRIYGLEPIVGEDRGGGRRTLVWVEGIPEPVIASRTERTILADMGQRDALASPLLDDALSLAQRVSNDADRVGPLLRRSIKSEAGVDFDELGRRARHLLEARGRAAVRRARWLIDNYHTLGCWPRRSARPHPRPCQGF
jgi:hypothetical protein